MSRSLMRSRKCYGHLRRARGSSRMSTVPFTEDQHSVGHLRLDCEHEPLRVGVRASGTTTFWTS